MLLNTCRGGIGRKADNSDSQVSHLFLPLDILDTDEACSICLVIIKNARTRQSNELLGRRLECAKLTL